MTSRQRLMFANGIVLGLFAIPSFFMDIRAIFFGAGPLVTALRGEPSSGIGFLEAHGLAAIFALWFLYVGRTQAPPARAWHFTGAAVHTLLGASNIALWHFFIFMDMLALGYVSTAVHIAFAVLQFVVGMRATSHRAAADALRN
ncbi:hypothetical protein LF41_575 [Lysobacter dokdonensis DS-58]|uniref:Transmembrane protein n=2 Tax=Noviluteimonas TaxID=3382693 RepID=A0A0A2WZY6_9GAMM|nr:hypothetical protein LF41_575 [Lysobacter dokdonensis DS-58]